VLALLVAGCATFQEGPADLPELPEDTQFAEVQGFRLHVKTVGDHGDWLLFVHGYSAAAVEWMPVVPELCRDHRCLLVDLPGFGLSDKKEGDYSPGRLAEMLVELLDQQGIEKAHVVAHSWGSSIALSLAHRHPERVGRLVLVGAWVYYEQLPTFLLWARVPVLGEAIYTLFFDEQPEMRYQQTYVEPDRHVTQKDVAAIKRYLHRRGAVRAALQAARDQRFETMQPWYPGIEKETLLVWGEQDRVSLPFYARRLAADLPRSRLVFLPRCGHMPHHEDPQGFVREVLQFLAAPVSDRNSTDPPLAAQTHTPPRQPCMPMLLLPACLPLPPFPFLPGALRRRRRKGRGRSACLVHVSRGPTPHGQAAPHHGGLRRATPVPCQTTNDLPGRGAPAGTETSTGKTERLFPLSSRGRHFARGGMQILRAATSFLLSGASSRVAVLAGAALLVAAWTAEAQELRAVTPYRNLLYEDPLELEHDSLRAPPWLEFSGAVRVRGAHMANLDLDRGACPGTGKTILGLSPGAADTFSSADMRLLVDPVFRLGPEVTVRSGLVLFDNLQLGSTPSAYPATPEVPMPAGSTSQAPPRSGVNSLSDSIGVSTLSLEWLSPVGLLLAGRTAGDWGLGLVANSGRCADCDFLQTADRVAWITSLFDALVAVSYDFDANGGHAGSWGNPAGGSYDLTDRDDLRTVNLAVAHYKLPGVTRRQILGGETAFHWGVSFSYRWQDSDLPGFYLAAPDEWPGDASGSQYVGRGLAAYLVDAWFRVASASLLLEGEGAWMYTALDSASMMPGVATARVTGQQYGGVLRARWRFPVLKLTLSAEAGLASGDEAYGFGARTGGTPKAGDMDGSQISFNGSDPDLEVNNFRFNSNFVVDEILWRRIVGTVTDAVYGKASVGLRPLSWLETGISGIYSRTLFAQSAPGIAKDLGFEGNIRLSADVADGLRFHLVGAWLNPLDGFRNLNVVPALEPADAWLVRGMAEARF